MHMPSHFWQRVPSALFASAITLAVLNGCAGGAGDNGLSAVLGEPSTDIAQLGTRIDNYMLDHENDTIITDAVVDPAMIHPGSLNDTVFERETGDFWYPKGNLDSSYYFVFTQPKKAPEGSILSVKMYYRYDSVARYNTVPCIVEDGHLKTIEPITFIDGMSFDFDLTFQDDFTCYDHNSGTIWYRSNETFGCLPQSYYEHPFAHVEAYRERGEGTQRIIFDEDHRFIQTEPDGTVLRGAWYVKSANVVWLVYDDPDHVGDEAVSVKEALATMTELEEKIQKIYEDSETNKLYKQIKKATKETKIGGTGNIWRLEFTIDSGDVLSSLGSYPTSASRGGVTYKGAFLIKTREMPKITELPRKIKKNEMTAQTV